MKRYREQTLYRQLTARFLFFLVLPLFFVLLYLAVSIFSEGKRNYEERLNLLMDRAMDDRKQHLQAVGKIEKRITGNEALKGFFLVRYMPENLAYYSSVIRNMLTPGPEESIYSVRVYFPNETIPRGFYTCYHLNDFVYKDGFQFLASDAEDDWVMPGEAWRYSSLYTPYARSYTHMTKVRAGNRLAYVLTVSVPEEEMDAFLHGEPAGKGGERESRTVTISRESITLDYSRGSRSYRSEALSIPGFPQKLVFLFGPDVQSRYVAVVITAVMLLSAALIIFALRYQLLKLTSRQAALLKDTQLMALQHQINPHFLYNTLEVFSYKMELYSHYEEAEAIVSLSRLLRYNVAENNGFTTLGEELKQVEHYLCIQRMKYREIDFKARINTELYRAEIPRFLLQPLIENSIVHGYCSRPLTIILDCEEAKGFLKFEIWDDGKGMSGKEQAKLNAALQNLETDHLPGAIGIGLKNINSRLRLLYSDLCHITVESRELAFTKLTFRIPAQDRL